MDDKERTAVDGIVVNRERGEQPLDEGHVWISDQQLTVHLRIHRATGMIERAFIIEECMEKRGRKMRLKQ